MAGIAQNRKKRLTFIVALQIRTKMREKGKRQENNKKKDKKHPKDMRMDKSKENTLMYIHMYICTHPRTYKYI